ncbi:DinB family protein [Pontibacter pudoricolor]|uniref:DinB family protein n=1 Tax=Pontibacter pudoricolor TaxID=2694930 RepID=UPI0013919998|nr:DinB family protein [Pontibacter pudoricolor]
MSLTELYLQTWQEARTRFTGLLANISEQDLSKKSGTAPNSAGFLIRHVGDVELLFAKNVFGGADVKVTAKTVISKCDTGEWTNLEELRTYQLQAADTLKAILQRQHVEDWQATITTKEFGTKTKAEAIGRIISHTAYHAGQLAMILKYGS